MPKLLAYNPSLGVVGRDGEVSVIKCSIPDYEPLEGVLKLLGDSFDVTTAGDLVNAVKDHLYGLRKHSVDSRQWVAAEKKLKEHNCTNLTLESNLQKYSACGFSGDLVGWDQKIY